MEELRSEVLLHYYLGDIYDKKVMNNIIKQYGVSRKYIINLIDEFNKIEERLKGGIR